VAATAAEAEALGQEPDDIHLPAPPDTSVSEDHCGSGRATSDS